MSLLDIWRSILTRADKILIVTLLLLSVSSYTIIRALFPFYPERTAIVQIEGREVARLSLSPELSSRKVPIEIKDGKAFLEVADGMVRMMPMADKLCPKHICSRTGWIEKPWQIIACLPNKIVVRIVGEKSVGDIDLITK